MKKYIKNLTLYLNNDLSRSLEKLKKSELYNDYRNFAEFLESFEEFNRLHRKKIPHPPHELATRDIGLEFTQRLYKHNMYPVHWFPGDFYSSYEQNDNEDKNIHTRVFHLRIYSFLTKKELFELKLSFPHLHNGFNFMKPKAEVHKINEANISDHVNKINII